MRLHNYASRIPGIISSQSYSLHCIFFRDSISCRFRGKPYVPQTIVGKTRRRACAIFRAGCANYFLLFFDTNVNMELIFDYFGTTLESKSLLKKAHIKFSVFLDFLFWKYLGAGGSSKGATRSFLQALKDPSTR